MFGYIILRRHYFVEQHNKKGHNNQHLVPNSKMLHCAICPRGSWVTGLIQQFCCYILSVSKLDQTVVALDQAMRTQGFTL